MTAADRAIRIVLLLATLLGAGLAVAIAWQRAFQVDEVETIHAAYNMATGKIIYRDFWQGHHPLLYVILGGILPTDDPTTAFLASRALALALFATTIALSSVLAARLGGMPLLASAILVLHTTFVERGIEVRPDGLMTCLVMAALALATHPSASRPVVFTLQGALLGLAFIVTQKAAIASFAFGCVWLASALCARDWRNVVLPCLAWTVPFALLLAILSATGAVEAYWAYNLGHPGESIAGDGAAAAGFSALGPILVECSRNFVFALAAVACLVVAPVAIRDRETPIALTQTAVLAFVWILGLFFMPFPYPYSHVGGLPALAVLISVLVPGDFAGRTTASSRWTGIAVVALVVGGIVTGIPRLLHETRRSNTDQLRLIERVHALTREGDPVFDLAGLYFRDDAYPVYLMTGAHFLRYQRGDYPPIASWLRENGLSVFLVNYRVKWLTGEDRAFLQTHFVRVEPNVFMSGSDLDDFAPAATKSFEVTRSDEYRFDGVGELWIDGRPFEQGRLARGEYTLTSPTGIAEGRLVLAHAPPYTAAHMGDARIFHPFD